MRLFLENEARRYRRSHDLCKRRIYSALYSLCLTGRLQLVELPGVLKLNYERHGVAWLNGDDLGILVYEGRHRSLLFITTLHNQVPLRLGQEHPII